MNKPSTSTNEQDVKKEIEELIVKAPTESLKQKLTYLYQLHNEKERLESDGYYKEYNQLKAFYETQFREYYTEVSKVTKGAEGLPTLSADDIAKYSLQPLTGEEETGVPQFWKTVLTNCGYFIINDKDEKILSHLIDVRTKQGDNSMNFTVEFEFASNEYFTETLLTKSYFFNENTDEVEKSVGSQIHWTSEEKNPRIKKTTKVIKKGKKSEKKSVEKVVPSFFDIFTDNTEDNLFKATGEAQFFMDELFPKMLEYYLDIEFDEEDDFGEDEEDEEDEDDDEESEEKKDAARGGKKNKKPNKGGEQEGKEKCKNQ